MNSQKKIYLISDVHIGVQSNFQPRIEHEIMFVEWLETIAPHSSRIILLGDIFDFWFEYPKHNLKEYHKVVRKLKELTSKGLRIDFFAGNHDMWSMGYLEDEIGLKYHQTTKKIEINGLKIVVGHGHDIRVDEGVGLKIMNSIFFSKSIYKVVTALVPPSVMNWIGKKWSRKNRGRKAISHSFRNEQEPIVKFCRNWLKKDSDVDHFIFGHLHTPTSYKLSDRATLTILGEWITNPQIVVIENQTLSLQSPQ